MRDAAQALNVGMVQSIINGFLIACAPQVLTKFNASFIGDELL